jgi:hypothetical protein
MDALEQVMMHVTMPSYHFQTGQHVSPFIVLWCESHADSCTNHNKVLSEKGKSTSRDPSCTRRSSRPAAVEWGGP